MCGIAGIISQSAVNSVYLQKMTQIIRHRGPDDEGYVLFGKDDWFVAGGYETANESWESALEYCPKQHIINTSGSYYYAAFGHRRLSIIDLSASGHQPMCSPDKRYWITYNGEIFNYIEIRESLKNYGYEFNTNTDTEVILAAYDKWGIDCQHRFNGMWAFAIYDRIQKTLFLSRDRFGIKPLYYWFSPQGDFYFASEIKQFTVLPEWRAIGNQQRILDYLFYSISDHTKHTMFQDVYQIQPGHFINFNVKFGNNGKNIQQVQWYNPKQTLFKGNFYEACEQFRYYFRQAVTSHLRSDVPVGSALSGGLDSTSIVCIINDYFKKNNILIPQKTFSAVSEIEQYSEKKWIDSVLEFTNVDSYFVYPKVEMVFNQIENITWHMDEPFQSLSPFLAYNVFAKAKQEGVTVLLNGQGADEYLNAYGLFNTLLINEYLKNLRLNKFFKGFQKIYGNNLIQIYRYLLPNSIVKFFKSKFNVVNGNIKYLLKNNITTRNYIHPYTELKYNIDNLWNVSDYQLFHDPLQRYLHWEDRNSMAHSVEARVPFLDFRLVEFTRTLPLEYLTDLDSPKKILTNALRNELPLNIILRKDKVGYMTAEAYWFKQQCPDKFIELFEKNYTFELLLKKNQVKEYLKSVQQGKKPFSYDYWRLIHLAVWFKTFDVNKIVNG